MNFKTKKNLNTIFRNAFLLFGFALLINSNALTAQEFAVAPVNYVSETKEVADVTWNTTNYDFGEIAHEIPATAEFILTNTTNKPFVIKDAKGSCGCTVPTWKKDIIAPGESTTINATYNAKKLGKFTKSVTIITSIYDEPIILRIKGEVVK